MILTNLLRRFAPLALVLLVSACGGLDKNIVVLLEDEDGSVGQVEVSTAKGSQVISEADQVVGIASANAPPRKPEPIAEKDVMEIFGEALAAEPDPAITFILYFEPDSIDLTPESEAQIDEVLDTIAARKSPIVTVTGHTDRVGEAEYNAQLSLERAELMRDLLVWTGLSPDLIDVTSHGEGNPLIPTADEVAEARNRRVEITVR